MEDHASYFKNLDFKEEPLGAPEGFWTAVWYDKKIIPQQLHAG